MKLIGNLFKKIAGALLPSSPTAAPGVDARMLKGLVRGIATACFDEIDCKDASSSWPSSPR